MNKIIKQSLFSLIPLILIIAGINFSPEWKLIQIGGGREVVIRLEDIILLLVVLLCIGQLVITKQYQFKKPPLFTIIISWLAFGFLSILISSILGYVSLLRGFFYFLKEVEFFLIYFYVYTQLKTLSAVKIVLKTWILFSLVNVGWVIYQTIKGLRFADYGPGGFGETGANPNGGYFMLLFVFFFNIGLYYFLKLPISNIKKIALMLIMVSPCIGIITSGSRGSIIGSIFILLPIILLFLSKKKQKLAAIFTIASILISLTIISFAMGTIFPFAKQRMNLAMITNELNPNYAPGRLSLWLLQIQYSLTNPLIPLIGIGKSVRVATETGLIISDPSHSQYIRNYIETGLIGSALFFILIWLIIKNGLQAFLRQKDPLIVGLSAGLVTITIAMLITSLGAENFTVVKIAETYWFFIGLTIATINLTKNNSSKLCAG